uniref:Oligopeptide transporter 1 n=1 Tax=Plectus sambesii TaxID=2011161 RepID=A0A914XMW3_9BILA
MNDQQKNSFTNDAFDGDADGVLTGKKSRPIQLRPEVSSEPEPQGCREIWRAWPKTTFCIVSNEFCERFSYYGMRTVLTLYLINILKVSDNGATALFHGFTVLAYSSPLLGSILADGYFGKFQTILWISLLYATGQVVLSVASTFAQSSSLHPYLDYTGLIIIAMGTGGIKPCVAAFGGDQFKIGQERMISLFFSMFYFSINAGSTISTFLTPEFRALPCMGRDSCYPLAFGIPAVLMVVATVFFVGGSFWYKKYPPKENVIFEVIKGIKTALANKRHFNVKRPHWMDHYLDNHSCESDIKCIELKSTGKKNKCHKRQFVDDVKSLLRVMVMYVPVPMFWALFDQQGSRWIIQGIAMDSRLSSSFSLLPDQMQTLNAILIMVFIPIFQLVIYPLVEKVGIKTTPLRRMSTGGLLAACAFVISALVQFKVNETLPDIPRSNQAFVSFINSYEGCTVNVSFNGNSKMIMPNSSLEDDKVTNQLNIFRIDGLPKNGLTSMGEIRTFQIAYSADNGGACAGLPGVTDQTNGVTNVDVIDMEGGHSYYLVLGPQGVVQRLADWRKPTEGEGEFKMKFVAQLS